MKDPKALPWTYQDGWIFKAELVKQKPKAYLLVVYAKTKQRWLRFWVPKSQVDFEPGHVWLPEWLYKGKGLTKRDGDPEMNIGEKNE